MLSTQDWLQRMRGGYVPPSPPEMVARSVSRPSPPPRREGLTFRDALRRMVIHPTDRPELVEAFVRGAGDLGKRLAHVLLEEGLKVAIVGRHELASQVTGHPNQVSQNLDLDHGAAGYYRPGERMVVLKEKYLNKENVTIHELAHAVDYILTARCGFEERLSTILWHGFKASRKVLADGYMLHGPHEYFAVSLEIYYKKGGRARLGRIDPDLLKFLDSFLS